MIANTNYAARETRSLGVPAQWAALLALLFMAALLPARTRAQDAPDTPDAPDTADSAPAGQTYDPYHAEKSLEIGLFYLHKGDLDAAIDRFQIAIQYRANFAKPRLRLGETYEKKGDAAEAVRYYKEYLKVLPTAADAKKIRSKIEKLTRETERKAARPASAKSP